MLSRKSLPLVVLIFLLAVGCLDPDVTTIRPEHQDARVPSNLCENVVCPLSEDPCTQDGVCDPATGECVSATRRDGDFCDDGDLCTEGERCLAGICSGGDPVVCQPISQCHEAGVCDSSSGCSTPLKPAGTSCGDGNPCTLDDQCDEVGDCLGTPRVCEALDGCHEAGVCNSATGECTHPKSRDGKPCDGPDTEDLCLTGTCVDASCILVEKVCPDTPCKVGQCISATGECGFDAEAQLPTGTPCQSEAFCSPSDDTQLLRGTTCDEAGECRGGVSVACDALLSERACDDANPCQTGEVCRFERDACDVDSPCPAGKLCQGGECVDGCSADNPCGLGAQCTERGVCVIECGVDEMCPAGTACSDSGECLAQGRCIDGCSVENPCPTGEVCTDGRCEDRCSDANPCPVGEFCDQDGLCVNDCLVRYACDDETGCYRDFKPDGTACVDQNPCTYNTRCQAGVCTGDVISCSPADQGTCQADGQCNVLTGQCEYSLKPAGSSCNTNLCQVNQVCSELGECLPGQERSCRAPGQCQLFQGCDPLVGCEYSPKPEGGTCYLPSQGPECDPSSEAPCGETGAICVEVAAVDSMPTYRCQLDCQDGQICALESDVDGVSEYRCKAPCSDGQSCTVRDACDVFRVGAIEQQLCKGEQKACNEPPNDQCYQDGSGVCDETSGECQYAQLPDGTECSDNDSCTGEPIGESFIATDRCQSGECTPGVAKVCEQALCQTVTCDGTIQNQASNCVSQAAEGAPCRQAEFCVDQATCNAQGECGDVVPNNCPLPADEFPESCFNPLGQCQEGARACYYTTLTSACDDGDTDAICSLQMSSVDIGSGTTRPSAVSAQEQNVIALVDLDNDGRTDVLIGGLDGLTFFHNQTPEGDLTSVLLVESSDFALEINALFSDDIRNVKALLVGDMNNDDTPDLIVLSYPNRTASVMRYFKAVPRPNPGGVGTAGFTFVAQPTYFPEAIQTNSPSSGVLADFDNDGDLDLYVGSYSGVDNLYLNELDSDTPSFVLGDNRMPRLLSNAKTTGVALADFGGDRLPDIAVCSESNENAIAVMLLEHGGHDTLASGELLKNVGLPQMGNGARSYCKSVSVADFDGDSDQDLFVNRFNRNQLLRYNLDSRAFAPVNDAKGLERSDRQHFQFCDAFSNSGPFELSEVVSWASAWGDWNADGYLDVYVARGAAEQPVDLSEQRYLMDGLYLVDTNQGAAYVDGVAMGYVTGDTRSSRSAVAVDLNNDGDLDLVVGHQTDRPKVIQNNTAQMNSFRFGVEGRTVNRDGVGTKVVSLFETAGARRAQGVLIGSNQSGTSGAVKVNHVGVGEAERVDVEASWLLPLGATVTQKIFDIASQSPSGALLEPTTLREPGCEIVDVSVEWGPDRFEDTPFSAGDAGQSAAIGEACTVNEDCESGYCDGSGASAVCAVAPACDDETLNGSETAKDCGGPDCAPCETNDVDGNPNTCLANEDCLSDVCDLSSPNADGFGICLAPACDDGTINGDETGMDCGGPVCPACGYADTNGTRNGCLHPSDCQSSSCNLESPDALGRGVCEYPACTDGIDNGEETALDCGGTECPGCEVGQRCLLDRDCLTLACDRDGDGVVSTPNNPDLPSEGICVEATCQDERKNGSTAATQESDVDCGGPICDPCDDGLSCVEARDCVSGVCSANVCQVPQCRVAGVGGDGVQNGSETDLDCGGSGCDGCENGRACSKNSDCESNQCTGSICRARINRSVNVRFKVRRFNNHSGLSVATTVSADGGNPVSAALGVPNYADGIAISEELFVNVLLEDANATQATILLQCQLLDGGTPVQGTQNQVKASLN